MLPIDHSANPHRRTPPPHLPPAAPPSRHTLPPPHTARGTPPHLDVGDVVIAHGQLDDVLEVAGARVQGADAEAGEAERREERQQRAAVAHQRIPLLRRRRLDAVHQRRRLVAPGQTVHRRRLGDPRLGRARLQRPDVQRDPRQLHPRRRALRGERGVARLHEDVRGRQHVLDRVRQRLLQTRDLRLGALRADARRVLQDGVECGGQVGHGADGLLFLRLAWLTPVVAASGTAPKLRSWYRYFTSRK